ncbi:MAG: D-sedoheptulose 7-phosphate isomerase [Flammeovirgaceae bacterium]|jgi:D-sedoheptulose 7-phosphate isomerase|nr:D-sedoheptulose 7-phosphate isomerase [Flammeovirgaceae bacterium]|tara:strand:- start:60236 stop:60829 length:594 start_codon:yes stop_codon:yes gene_type:complete
MKQNGDSIQLIREELKEAQGLLEKFIASEEMLQCVSDIAAVMINAIQEGGKIISCGNGGSHCDAVHFAEELTGRYRDHRKALPAMAISDAAHLTCVGNDYGFEAIFSRFIEGMGNSGDVLLAISTSGNSMNIVNAVRAAKEKNMKTIVLAGKDGGKLAEMADVVLIVPHFGFADRIQEIHIKIIHILILLIEQKITD